MIENLLALAGVVCLTLAIAGLAGFLWALAFVGIVLLAAAYAAHTQAAPPSVAPASSSAEAPA